MGDHSGRILQTGGVGTTDIDSSAELAAILGDETGTGKVVFGTGPNISPPIEANTAGVGSPNILIGAETGLVLSNEGSGAKNYHTLPTAVAGLTFTFVCQDSDGIRIVASSGDTIRLAGSVSVTAGYIESTTVGSTVTLTAINATEWIGTSIVLTWVVETS